MDADQIAMSLPGMWEALLPLIPGLRMARKGGAYAVINDQPSPVNGVDCEWRSPDAGAVDALLDEVAASGLPYLLRLRPGAGEALARLATGRGMTRAEGLPLMLLDSAAVIQPPAPGPGFVIRELTPAESALHVAVAAPGSARPPNPSSSWPPQN